VPTRRWIQNNMLMPSDTKDMDPSKNHLDDSHAGIASLPPDDGKGENDDHIASLLQELNEVRKKTREKDSLLSDTQERLITLEESMKQITAKNEYEKADDHADQNIDDHHMHGLDRELAQSVGIDSIATYGHYVNAQRNLRFRKRSSAATSDLRFGKRSSAATSALSTTFRSEIEIEVIQNIATRTHSTDWDEIREGLGINDENGHAVTPFYSPPVQRQRYGDDKILPHVGWGDLFFDLFFVGAAYNLGVLLKTCIGADHQLRSSIYFLGSLGPLWACWDSETFYQSRYLTIDYCHRITEVLRYIFVASAIFNITRFQDYRDPLNANVLIYTLAMMLEQMMQLALRVELYFKGLGDEIPIKNHSLYEITFRKLPFLGIYIAAFVAAVISYSRAFEIIDREDWDLNDLPMTLTAIIYVLELFFEFSWYFGHNFVKNKDVRTYFVPVNVDYLIKRYSEFVLLMLGECFISLLGIGQTIVSEDYYMVVFFGVVTVIWLLFLLIECEPSDAQAHALWGSRWNTVCYFFLIQIITICLIGLGASFKVFLHEEIAENTEGWHEEQDYEDIQTTIFAIALSLVVVSLELLYLCHTGIKGAVGHLFQHTDDGRRELSWPIFIVSLIKLGIFLCCFTLSRWIREAEYIVPAGCVIVIALSVTRVVASVLLRQKALSSGRRQNNLGNL